MHPRVSCVSHSLEVGNTLSQIHAGDAVDCMFVFPCLGLLEGAKPVLAFPKIYSFDPARSIKVLASKIEKVFFKYGAILPRQGMSLPVPS